MPFRLEDRPRTWMLYSCLLALIASFYFTDLPHLPLDHDEHLVLRENAAISQAPATLFLGQHNPSGRPMGHLVRWGLYELCGNDIRIFRLFSIVTHLAVCASLALLARRMGATLAIGLLAGLLFLINVAHSTAVYHLAALEYLSSVLFVLWSTLAFLNFLDRGDKRWFGAALLTASLGVLSHMSALCLVPFLCWWTIQRAKLPQKALRYIAPLAIWLGVLATLTAGIAAGASQTTTARTIAYLHERSIADSAYSFGTAFLWLLARLFDS